MDSTIYSEIFLWLNIEEGQLENATKAKGHNQAIEFGYWVKDGTIAARMNAGKWNTKIGTSNIEQITGGWQFSLEIEDTSIKGSCLLKDEVKIENYELPAYSTIWQPGIQTQAFTVYTFQGHKSQKCIIDAFEVQGEGTIANLLRESLHIQNPYCVVMYGWEAEAAHYVRGK